MGLTEIELFDHPIYQDYACDIHTGDIYSLENNQIKLIKQSTDSKGYLCFEIGINGNFKTYRSHRFIYECHSNKILPKNICVDHIDGNRKNNNINNLREVNNLGEVNNFINSLNIYEYKEVDELPDDKIRVIKYNDHYFENLWFSPSTNCCYRISEGYIFEIPFNSVKRVDLRDINKMLTYIYLNKLRKILGC